MCKNIFDEVFYYNGSQFEQYTINNFDSISFYHLISRGKNGLKSIRMEKKVDRAFANKVITNTDIFRNEVNRLRIFHENTKKSLSGVNDTGLSYVNLTTTIYNTSGTAVAAINRKY